MNTYKFDRRDDDLKEVLAELTDLQLSFFLKLTNGENRAAYALTEEGGLVSTLQEKGLIEKFGKVGRRQKWRACWLNNENLDFIYSILGQSRMYKTYD